LQNYRFIVTDPTTQRALLNTVALMFIASTACVVIGCLLSFALLRKIRFGRIAIDAVLLIPWAIPGLILGVALLWTYINVPGMYGTFWGVLLGFVTLGIPLAMRSTGSVLSQLSSDLEEASAVHGANAATTLRRIVVPLIMPGLVSAWFTLATLFSRELSVSVMLYGFGSEVASVQLLSYWEQGEGTRVAALSVLLVAFVFLLYVLQQKVTNNLRIPEPR
jgi:iron(III) transport system permease protein